MRPTARSLVLDLLSALPEGTAVPIGALIRAAAVFGMAGNGVRVAVTRLTGAGLLQSDERGLYRLGTGAEAVGREVRAWRTLEEQIVSWEGGWIGIHTAALPRSDRRERRRRTRALELRGFRSLQPGLEIRPDNLVGGVAAERLRLGDLGLDPRAPVFALDELDDDHEARCLELWDANALVSAHRKCREQLERSTKRLPSLSQEKAMAESFSLGGAAIRQLVLDPQLPNAIVPHRERCALLKALRRYDRLGRRYWKGWTGLDSITLEGSPAHMGGDVLSRKHAV